MGGPFIIFENDSTETTTTTTISTTPVLETTTSLDTTTPSATATPPTLVGILNKSVNNLNLVYRVDTFWTLIHNVTNITPR